MTRITATAVLLSLVAHTAVASDLVDAGEPFGELPMIDEVVCGETDGAHQFKESAPGASRVERILGERCRVLPTAGDAKYFAYVLGRGKGLRPGAAYVLSVEYPEDKPRSMFVGNRGAEINLGFATGRTVGDAFKGRYVNHNVESLAFPLSGRYETWTTLFYLHDVFPAIAKPRGDSAPRSMRPEDGFRVVVCQSKGSNHPQSAGAAVRRIRLFAVERPARFDVKLRLPPKGLPRRHLFWREEMSDGVVGTRDVAKRGVKDPLAWFDYKMRLMKFWGMNTVCKDMLEFGANQGWDSSVHGGNDWVYQAQVPDWWEKIVERATAYGMDLLPYYEYYGSKGKNGLGFKKRCRPLGGNTAYTHVKWCEVANADITDPDTYEDFRKMLHATVTRYAAAAKFVGVWIRNRPSAMPVSFSDRCLALFAREANDGVAVTRGNLKSDSRLREKYYAWWLGKRRAFFVKCRDYLRANGVPDAVVMCTTDSSEPGIGLGADVVTDDPAAWLGVEGARRVLRYDDVLRRGLYAKALTSWRGTWGKWEWQHSCPRADPENMKDVDGVMFTYSFNRAYTVSSPAAFETFRTPTGLAVVRHYGLNENEMEDKVGYFVSDVERAGPHCMLGEARAVAYGDPRYVGYLASNCFNRGFPKYVRRFNTAFLSLPALPSRIIDAASGDDVVVREIPTERHGTYYAVVNVSLVPRETSLLLPAPGGVVDAATGEGLSSGSSVRLKLAPCELRALHVTGAAVKVSSAPARSGPVSVPDEMRAAWDDRLRGRAREAVASGRAVSLYVNAMSSRMKVVAMDDEGELTLSKGGLKPKMAWARLSDAERASLAAALAEGGEPDDLLLAGFWFYAAGDAERAEEQLRRAPRPEAMFVRSLFE